MKFYLYLQNNIVSIQYKNQMRKGGFMKNKKSSSQKYKRQNKIRIAIMWIFCSLFVLTVLVCVLAAFEERIVLLVGVPIVSVALGITLRNTYVLHRTPYEIKQEGDFFTFISLKGEFTFNRYAVKRIRSFSMTYILTIEQENREIQKAYWEYRNDMSVFFNMYVEQVFDYSIINKRVFPNADIKLKLPMSFTV